jgi:hypothetical protein
MLRICHYSYFGINLCHSDFSHSDISNGDDTSAVC